MAVFGLLASLAAFIRVRFLIDKAKIDNSIFRLHYRFTCAVFFTSCILLTAFDLIGNPIDCITDDGFPRPDALNTFCWIQSTYTIPGLKHKQLGTEVIHHQVGPESGKPGQDGKFHTYYQWVPFMLFLQGCMFYLPHAIWKRQEEYKIRAITEGMRGNYLCESAERTSKSKILSSYIYETLHTHNAYAYKYVLCELLNLINVLGQIFFIDKFFNGVFLEFGSKVIQFTEWEQENRTDPLREVFPLLTKCNFQKYGPSGTLNTHDALCVLALNVLNEKIYVFVWFWLVFLSVLSALALVYRLVTILSPVVRVYLFQRISKLPNRNTLDAIVQRTQYGDFFFLLLLSKNLDGMAYKETLEDLGHLLALEDDGFNHGNHNKEEPKRKLSNSRDTSAAPFLTNFATLER